MRKQLVFVTATLGVAASLAACGDMAAHQPDAAARPAAKTGAATEAPANATILSATFAPDATLGAQIVNGKITARGARPYQVALTNARGNQFCGGSLIASNWVLTAAHCVDGSSASGLYIRAGVNRLSSNQGEYVAVQNIYIHPNYYDVDRGSDIALLKLKNNVTNAYADTINLPSDSVESVLDVAGKYATVSGWGLTETGYSSDDLREVSIPITPNPTRCGGNYVPGDVICGEYYEDKDSCNGDSGGPLAASYNGQMYVLGVVSYGPKACRGYGVYTRVNAYLDWIERTSGVTPGGTAPAPGDPVDPPASGTVTYEGNLSSGATGYAPSDNGFYYSGGRIQGEMSAGSTTDFDLYLQKKSAYGWDNVAKSEGYSSNESINYYAAAGTYRWAIYAYSGSGDVTLVETKE